MKTESFNLHAFKLLLQLVQTKLKDFSFKTVKDCYEVASRITEIDTGKRTYDDRELSISVELIRRYWGFQKDGLNRISRKRSHDILNLLVRICRPAECESRRCKSCFQRFTCGFVNWEHFQAHSKDSIVTNVLEDERKGEFWNSGIWRVEYAKDGDIKYFGNHHKYIALQKIGSSLILADFKNIFEFNDIPWTTIPYLYMEITGVEVIQKENQEINIRLIY